MLALKLLAFWKNNNEYGLWFIAYDNGFDPFMYITKNCAFTLHEGNLIFFTSDFFYEIANVKKFFMGLFFYGNYRPF